MIAKRIKSTHMASAQIRVANSARRLSVVAVPMIALAAWFCFAPLPAKAQDSKLADGPPPPPAEESTQPAQPDRSAEAATAAEPAEPPEPVLDPVGASRSLDVGSFYLKRGDYDAAIDRFREAAQRQPKLAKPFLLMGEAYEKKGDPASAITAYRKYLQMFRTAPPDADKVNKRIEKLTELQAKRDNIQH